jgi:hypothetical protein
MRSVRIWAAWAVLGSGFWPAAALGQCPSPGSCVVPHGTPGCDDAVCCDAVCAEDVFCCKGSWDLACVQIAVQLCDTCPGPGDCLTFNGSPGCEDEQCCEAVCEMEPLCCQTKWDGQCAGIAEGLCPHLCLGDQNDDGSVDVQDLVMVITDWSCVDPPGPCPGDVNGDLVVDVTDLVLLILEWGPCGG